jgi:hypothetical protein
VLLQEFCTREHLLEVVPKVENVRVEEAAQTEDGEKAHEHEINKDFFHRVFLLKELFDPCLSL